MNQDFLNLKKLKQYCIIMADIDHFKKVNDTFGHCVGDSVLCGVANIFQGCVRKKDIVARFGGEEFCIILHKVSPNQALSIAEVMRQKVESSRFDDISVTCSFGVTSIEFNAKESGELIVQADKALYQSKYSGRNQVTLWDPTLEKVGEIKNIQ
jgi:diguanylate cyclase (GGDEF)-like protein